MFVWQSQLFTISEKETVEGASNNNLCLLLVYEIMYEIVHEIIYEIVYET